MVARQIRVVDVYNLFRVSVLCAAMRAEVYGEQEAVPIEDFYKILQHISNCIQRLDSLRVHEVRHVQRHWTGLRICRQVAGG